MSTLTDKQFALMDAIAHAEHNTTNGATPTAVADVNTWLWVDEFADVAGLGVKAAGGVLTTLQEAGLIGVSKVPKRRGQPDESSVWFTPEGFAAWDEYRRAHLPHEVSEGSVPPVGGDGGDAIENAVDSGSWDDGRLEGGRPPEAEEHAQRAIHAEDEVIEVVSMPTARAGSLRAARYAELRTGRTVREYLDAATRAAPTRPRFKRHADLLRLEREGYIALREAARNGSHAEHA